MEFRTFEIGDTLTPMDLNEMCARIEAIERERAGKCIICGSDNSSQLVLCDSCLARLKSLLYPSMQINELI